MGPLPGVAFVLDSHVVNAMLAKSVHIEDFYLHFMPALHRIGFFADCMIYLTAAMPTA